MTCSPYTSQGSKCAKTLLPVEMIHTLPSEAICTCCAPLVLQALHTALTAWRAEAAAAGSVQMLTSLTQAEVLGLSDTQAEAVRRQVMQLEAQGRLLLRQAAAGHLDVSQLTPDETAALAWKAHTQQASAVEELVQQVLAQVSSYRQHTLPGLVGTWSPAVHGRCPIDITHAPCKSLLGCDAASAHAGPPAAMFAAMTDSML